MDPLEPYAKQGMTWERAMGYAKELAERAALVVATDPNFSPVGVILTPDTAEIRELLPQLLREGTAQPGDWVPLLLPRDQVLALLRGNAPQSQDWLASQGEGTERILPVVVVTPFGYRLGGERYRVEPAGRPPARVQCSVNALILCRQTFRKVPSQRWCVIGTLERLRVPKLPRFEQLALFVSLGDFVSGSKLLIRIGREDDELCRIEAEVGFGKQIGTLEVGLPLPSLRFAHAGLHKIDMLTGGKVIASRTLVVELAGRPR